MKKSDAGHYSCTAKNKYGIDKCDAVVTVCEDKDIFGDKSGKILPAGEQPTFEWKRNGVGFDPEERFKVLLGDDEDSLALVFQHVKPEDAGIYTCVAQVRFKKKIFFNLCLDFNHLSRFVIDMHR